MKVNYEKHLLSNGISVYTIHKAKTPRVAIDISIKGGMTSGVIPGDLRLATRLSLKGTENYSQSELSKIIDDNALSISYSVLPDYSVCRCVCLNDKTFTAISLLSEIIFKPTFNKIEDEKLHIKGEISYSLDMPAELCTDNLNKTMYSGHPYGNTSSIILENMEKISKESLTENYYNTLANENIIIVIVGDYESIDKAQILQKLEDEFANNNIYALSPTLADKNYFLKPIDSDLLVTKILPRTNQAHINAACHTVKRGDKNQAAIALLANVLGGYSLTSRLFLELRDKEGLAYSVNSQYIPYNETGQFVISIGTSPDNIKKALQGFKCELDKLQSQLIGDEELDRVKSRIISSQLIASQTNTNIASNVTNGLANGFDVNFTDELMTKVESISSHDILKLAQALPCSSVISIVSNNEKSFEI